MMYANPLFLIPCFRRSLWLPNGAPNPLAFTSKNTNARALESVLDNWKEINGMMKDDMTAIIIDLDHMQNRGLAEAA